LGIEHAGFKSPPSCKLPPVSRNHLPIHHLQRRNTLRAVLASLLVLAMLWTQSLGLWHRLVHFDAGHPAAKLALVMATAGDTAGAHALNAPKGKPFSNHQTDTDCQLFDQLSHADSVSTAAMVALGLTALPHILRASHGLAVARWHALFQARGPPSVR